jgi:hypothetical protein
MSATIIELQAENIKRLRAIRIVPKGSTGVLTGKNDQGKSSALDSIDYAFRGEKEICDEPLRKGEKRGVVRLKLSEELSGICSIERRFTPGGTVLEVRNAEGVPQKSPQALLDSVISKVTFDPLSFVRMKSAEQMELLRKLVGLDFTQLNTERKRAFDERAVRNRELESARARLGGYPFDPSLPEKPVEVVDLAKQLGDAQSKNAQINQRRRAVTEQENKTFDLSEDIRSLQEKVKTLEKMLADTRSQIEAKTKAHAESKVESERMKAEIATIQNIDESALRKQIDDIQSTNAKIEANRRHNEAQAEVVRIETEAKALTQAIAEFDAEKAAQIEFAEFPMPGLSFDEERGVLLNGVPFSQGSQARQLQAAVSIGLALNPQIRVILIRDGSLLDEDSMKLVSEMAEKASAQVWIEVVGSKDPAAIVIEDGEVKA